MNLKLKKLNTIGKLKKIIIKDKLIKIRKVKMTKCRPSTAASTTATMNATKILKEAAGSATRRSVTTDGDQYSYIEGETVQVIVTSYINFD